MKVFENIAEYKAFKRKYELMGLLEEERMSDASKDPESIKAFFQFMDEAKELPQDKSITEQLSEEELRLDIDRQQLLIKLDARS